MKRISVDITAINMDGQGSFSSTYLISSKEELKQARDSFDRDCPFSKSDVEAYAEHEDGSELSPEEKGWFEELGISL